MKEAISNKTLHLYKAPIPVLGFWLGFFSENTLIQTYKKKVKL